MKIHQVGVKSFHAYKQTNMAQQIAAFPNSASAPNNITKLKKCEV